jgi:hypothetical protein
VRNPHGQPELRSQVEIDLVEVRASLEDEAGAARAGLFHRVVAFDQLADRRGGAMMRHEMPHLVDFADEGKRLRLCPRTVDVSTTSPSSAGAEWTP